MVNVCLAPADAPHAERARQTSVSGQMLTVLPHCCAQLLRRRAAPRSTWTTLVTVASCPPDSVAAATLVMLAGPCATTAAVRGARGPIGTIERGVLGC